MTDSVTESFGAVPWGFRPVCPDQLAAEPTDKVQYSIVNLEFHVAIHEATDNHWLIEQLQYIGIHIDLYRSLPYDLRGRLTKSTEEHSVICEAILFGEGDKVSDLMRNHIMLQRKRLPFVLKLLA